MSIPNELDQTTANGEQPTPTVPSITIGTHHNRPQGSLRMLSLAMPVVAALATAIKELDPTEPNWLSLATFTNSYRDGDNWRSSFSCGTDIDYYDQNGKHAVPPPVMADKLAAAARAGELGGNLFHQTPRGMRVITVYDQVVIDPRLGIPHNRESPFSFPFQGSKSTAEGSPMVLASSLAVVLAELSETAKKSKERMR